MKCEMRGGPREVVKVWLEPNFLSYKSSGLWKAQHWGQCFGQHRYIQTMWSVLFTMQSLPICCVFAFLMFALLCIGRIHKQQTVCSVPEHWALRAASGQLMSVLFWVMATLVTSRAWHSCPWGKSVFNLLPLRIFWLGFCVLQLRMELVKLLKNIKVNSR